MLEVAVMMITMMDIQPPPCRFPFTDDPVVVQCLADACTFLHDGYDLCYEEFPDPKDPNDVDMLGECLWAMRQEYLHRWRSCLGYESLIAVLPVMSVDLVRNYD